MTINPDGRQSEGVTPSGSGCQPTASAAEEASSRGGIPNAAVADVVLDLEELFGPGCSNGVAAILLHPDLPERFSRKEWKDWMFRPAETAFYAARDMGLISRWKLTQKWVFTDLGLAVSQHMRAASADTHPKGGDVEQAPLVSGAVGEAETPKVQRHD